MQNHADRQPSRTMLAIGGLTYLLWWFAVEAILPDAFNPLGSRLVVVAYLLGAYALTFFSEAVRRTSDRLYYVGAMFITAHYFYLFHHNANDINWVVGAYLLVFACSVSIQSRKWLIAFSGVTFAFGLGAWVLDPSLRQTIFLPGLVTINILCLVMLLGRMRLMEELTESTRRFHDLFDATFEAIAVHDHGKILDANEGLEKMFGYPRAELIGLNVLELLPPDIRESARVQLADPSARRYETVGQRKDGTRLAIEVSGKSHVYQGGLQRLAAIRDITEAKQADAERIQLAREHAARISAQEALKARDEFMSIASHELRTPLTSLMLQLEAFVRNHKKLEPSSDALLDIANFSTRARRQYDRLGRLVEELLDVSRLEAGQPRLVRETVDLNDLVRDVADSMEEDLRRARCSLRIEREGQITGEWDRLRIEQVLTALLRNALIYGSGKPIEIETHAAPDTATLVIRDHGIGISKEDQGKVFERFERAVSARHYGGLGLGLYIVRQIVQVHGGTIRVDSEPNTGATFFVELPIKPPDRDPAAPIA